MQLKDRHQEDVPPSSVESDSYTKIPRGQETGWNHNRFMPWSQFQVQESVKSPGRIFFCPSLSMLASPSRPQRSEPGKKKSLAKEKLHQLLRRYFMLLGKICSKQRRVFSGQTALGRRRIVSETGYGCCLDRSPLGRDERTEGMMEAPREI